MQVEDIGQGLVIVEGLVLLIGVIVAVKGGTVQPQVGRMTRVVVVFGFVLGNAQDVGLVRSHGAHAVDGGIDLAQQQFAALRARTGHCEIQPIQTMDAMRVVEGGAWLLCCCTAPAHSIDTLPASVHQPALVATGPPALPAAPHSFCFTLHPWPP